jgi:hypothetical protein
LTADTDETLDNLPWLIDSLSLADVGNVLNESLKKRFQRKKNFNSILPWISTMSY